MNKESPRVGVGVIVLKEGKILMGRRKGAHGEGTWSVPGGHLEYKESLEECAKREVMEETGLEVENLREATFTNDIFDKENRHYITLYVLADYIDGTPQVCEPEKCFEWGWFEWGDLPEPLFIPITNLLDQEYNPFE